MTDRLVAASLRTHLLRGTALVAVLAMVAGLAFALSGHQGKDASSAAPAGAAESVLVPAHTSGDEGLAISYGRADAPRVLAVYADPRCPYCAKAEAALGGQLRALADTGDYRIDYHFATFLDGALGGRGSNRALNALGAAANVDQAKFADYLAVLYAHQPAQESTDTFGSTAKLLELADQVPGLRTPAFNKAVKELSYSPWATRVSEAFYATGVTGTPTITLDGKPLTVIDRSGAAVTPAAFTQQVRSLTTG